MSNINQKPSHFRTGVAHGNPQVTRNAGMFDAGSITDVSIITRGEALGHDLWIDHQFLSDVTAEVNHVSLESPGGGLKARFTHPGLSSDGIGQKLGRLRNARVDGDQVIADLHFQQASTRTPDGDLADYTMTLAEETPEDFGLSIVFEHDLEAQNEHVATNTQGGKYVSPDEDNKNNFVHARLGDLRSADVVDSPAANPDGLFTRGQEAAKEGEAIMEYALGLSDAKPNSSRFSVDPDRLAQFVQRFLERHNLSLTKGGEPVSEVKELEVVDAPTREDFAAELDRFVIKFGAENGTKWFMGQISYESAMELHLESLEKQVKLQAAKIGELEEVISSLEIGEEDGADFVADDEAPVKKEKALNNRIRIQGRDYN